jgi:ferredoxin-NADP reductase
MSAGFIALSQALLRMFGPDETDEPATRVILLFACQRRVYLKEQLEEMQARFPDHLKITYAMSARGRRLDKALLQQTCQRENLRDDEDKVFVCGPPSFYGDFCGPRNQRDVTGFLQELGFTSKSVVKF